MTSATIKLFLPRGDAKSLRTAEISNWTGKAVAAPRTELDELLAREELDKAGVYILIGSDPLTSAPRAYIGEAEIIRDRNDLGPFNSVDDVDRVKGIGPSKLEKMRPYITVSSEM